MQNSLLQLVGVRSQAEPFTEYSKKMEFAQPGNLSKFCERNIPDEMLMKVVSCLDQYGRSRSRSLRRPPGTGNRQQVGEGVYKAAFDLKRGGPEIKTPVRREQAIPDMNIIQNGCAEMQAS
jgi:hypothetical protein